MSETRSGGTRSSPMTRSKMAPQFAMTASAACESPARTARRRAGARGRADRRSRRRPRGAPRGRPRTPRKRARGPPARDRAERACELADGLERLTARERASEHAPSGSSPSADARQEWPTDLEGMHRLRMSPQEPSSSCTSPPPMSNELMISAMRNGSSPGPDEVSVTTFAVPFPKMVLPFADVTNRAFTGRETMLRGECARIAGKGR